MINVDALKNGRGRARGASHWLGATPR